MQMHSYILSLWIILIYNNFLPSTVNFCLNAFTYDGLLVIEIQSFVHTGSIVVVDSISEGSSLTLKFRILQYSTRYYNIFYVFMQSCTLYSPTLLWDKISFVKILSWLVNWVTVNSEQSQKFCLMCEFKNLFKSFTEIQYFRIICYIKSYFQE